MRRLSNRTDFIYKLCESISTELMRKPPPCTTLARFVSSMNKATEVRSPSENLRVFMEFFDTIPGYDPSYFQRKLFRAAAELYAPVIMKGASSAEQSVMMKEYDLDILPCSFVVGITGRRVGKTDTVTIIGSALLVATPYLTVGFCSLFESTCKTACDAMEKWLRLQGYGNVLSRTALKIVLRFDAVDIRVANFFSSQSPDVIQVYFSLFFFYFPQSSGF